jgi:pimeloyl-ACP methyl ester carboxylesterase
MAAGGGHAAAVAGQAVHRRPNGEARSLRVRGHLVRYRDSGGLGPPVMLVHGLGCSPGWWRDVTPALARHHRVIVPDLPGFELAPGGAPFRLSEGSAVLARLLERVEVGRVSLVGHSLGALVCLGMAARAPETVERLVLISPPVRTAGPAFRHHAIPLARTAAAIPMGALARVTLGGIGRSPLAIWRAAEEMLQTDHLAGLAEIRAPTLLLWGREDRLVPLQGARELLEMIPGSSLRIIDAGHSPMLDAPATLTSELLTFLH